MWGIGAFCGTGGTTVGVTASFVGSEKTDSSIEVEGLAYPSADVDKFLWGLDMRIMNNDCCEKSMIWVGR